MMHIDPFIFVCHSLLHLFHFMVEVELIQFLGEFSQSTRGFLCLVKVQEVDPFPCPLTLGWRTSPGRCGRVWFC